MRDEDVIDMQEAAEKHEAMDYAQHEGTWAGFTTLVKWAIIELAFLLLALFCFIEAGQMMLGWFLVIVGILLIPGSMLFAPRRQTA
jgi:uncharacterized iron-regulated membrane protein